MAFLHLVKVVCDVFEDKCEIWTRCSEAKLLHVELNGLQDLHDISTSGYYEGEKTSTVESEYLRIVFNNFVFYWVIIWIGAVHTL